MHYFTAIIILFVSITYANAGGFAGYGGYGGGTGGHRGDIAFVLNGHQGSQDHGAFMDGAEGLQASQGAYGYGNGHQNAAASLSSGRYDHGASLLAASESTSAAADESGGEHSMSFSFGSAQGSEGAQGSHLGAGERSMSQGAGHNFGGHDYGFGHQDQHAEPQVEMYHLVPIEVPVERVKPRVVMPAVDVHRPHIIEVSRPQVRHEVVPIEFPHHPPPNKQVYGPFYTNFGYAANAPLANYHQLDFQRYSGSRSGAGAGTGGAAAGAIGTGPPKRDGLFQGFANNNGFGFGGGMAGSRYGLGPSHVGAALGNNHLALFGNGHQAGAAVANGDVFSTGGFGTGFGRQGRSRFGNNWGGNNLWGNWGNWSPWGFLHHAFY